MKITGQFQFLHTINTAWILDCLRSTRASRRSLTLRLHAGQIFPFHESAEFLDSFQLADRIEPADPGELSSSNAPSLPSPTAAENILSRWYEAKLNASIFSDLHSFVPVLQTLRSEGRILVTTNGCFDVLHPGHLETIRSASRFGDVLVVLINSDASIKRFKGPTRPIHQWKFRAALLSQISAIDYVVVFDEDTPLDILSAIQPSHHVKGGSFINERIQVEQDLLATWGGSLQTLSMRHSYSTSSLLQLYPGPPFPI